ncbi:hypothetical protein [Luteimonas sp. A501]
MVDALSGATKRKRVVLALALAALGLVLTSCLYDPTAHANPPSETSMIIDQLDAPAGATELAASSADAGAVRLHDELDTYLRGQYRIAGQRTFTIPDIGWTALDSHVANALGHLLGYARHDVPWRRPGKDLFAIHQGDDDAIAVGLLREPGADGRTLVGYFQLEAPAP